MGSNISKDNFQNETSGWAAALNIALQPFAKPIKEHHCILNHDDKKESGEALIALIYLCDA